MATKKQRSHPSGRVVSVRLEDELIERLDALSARTNRSRGLYLKLALRASLPTLEQLHWAQRAVELEDRVLDRQFHALMTQLGDAGPGEDSTDDPTEGTTRDVPLW